MSEEREIEQFSLNIYYIMEEDKTTILDHQHNELGSLIQKFNQEEKNFHIFDYNFSNASMNLSVKSYNSGSLDLSFFI